MEESVGEKVKRLRISRNISQKVLCMGICSQSEISKIENNKIIASSYVLHQIANKLGVDSDYLYRNIRQNLNNSYIQELKFQFERVRRNRDYSEMNTLLENESKNHPLLKDLYIKNYLIWHQGIVTYHFYNKADEALRILSSILERKHSAELDIEILNSMGIICRNENRQEEAVVHFELALNKIKELMIYSRSRLSLKISYNLSKAYSDLHLIDKSIKICNESIKHCKENEDLYLLAEFYYQLGRNLLIKGDAENGIKNWNSSIDTLKIADRTEFISLIKKEIESYQKFSIID